MKKRILGSAAALLIAMPALAQMPMGQKAAEPETRAQVQARLKANFAEIDTNKDGALSRDEADAFRTVQEAKMRDMAFATIDADKNGAISRDEFNTHFAARGKGMGHSGAGAGTGHMGGKTPGSPMFDAADANKDGKVTLTEASAQALAMFDKADSNKDGTISADERAAAMKKMGHKGSDPTR